MSTQIPFSSDQDSKKADTRSDALHWAAARGDLPTVQMLLGQGANLSDTALGDCTPLELAAKGGHLEVLNALLAAGANFNTVNAQGASPLFSATTYGHETIVQALLKVGASFELPQPIKIIKETVHIEGLSTEEIILSENPKKVIKAEGNRSVSSWMLLEELFKSYLETVEHDSESYSLLAPISIAISNTTEHIKCMDIQKTSTTLVDGFKAGAYTLIPSGWIGHEITLVFYQDPAQPDESYLVIVNRGEGSEKGRFEKDRLSGDTVIYKLLDSQKNTINEAFIKKLGNLNPSLNSQAIMKLIEEKLSDQPPLAILSSKHQEHSTCSFVNPKNSIESVLFLMKFKKLKNNGYSDKDAIIFAKNYARIEYKKFTHYIREQGIDRLIEFKNNASSLEDKNIAIQLASEIIAQHHGKTKSSIKSRRSKIKAELARELRLLQAFTLEERREIIDRVQSKSNAVFEVDLLYSAIKHEKQPSELVTLLQEAGASKESFMSAAFDGDMILAQSLYSKSDEATVITEVTAKTRTGQTALLLAAAEERMDVISFVLQILSTADPKVVLDTITAENRNQQTVLTYAASTGNIDMATAILSGVLSDKKNNRRRIRFITKKTTMGNTALILAAKNGHTAIVKAILEALPTDSAKAMALEQKDAQGYTALNLAIKGNHHETIDFLQNFQKDKAAPSLMPAFNTFSEQGARQQETQKQDTILKPKNPS